MPNTEQRQARALNHLAKLHQVAAVTMAVVRELKRIKDSEELDEILRKGQSAIRIVGTAAEDAAEIITGAATEAAGDVQDIILLALQIYEKSQLRGRTLNTPHVMPLDQIATRDELIDQVVLRLHRPEHLDPAA